MPVSKEQVLQLLAQKGPSVPAELTYVLRENTIIVGALLSVLIAEGAVKITSAKIGGSPLYYVPQDYEKITRLREHLNEKDRRAYDELVQQKIIFDDEQTPLMRTCLRSIKDFSMPVKVTVDGKELLFWRWYLTSQEEAQNLIGAYLKKNMPKPQVTQPAVQTPQPKIEAEQKTEQKPESKIEAKIPAVQILQAQQERQHEFIQTIQTTIPLEKQEKVTEKTEKKTRKKEVTAEPERQHVALDPNQVSGTSSPAFYARGKDNKEDVFAKSVLDYCASKKIYVVDMNIIKTNNELDLIVKVPSTVGEIRYYVKAKKKKTCNEGDLAAALIAGQAKRLPVLFMCAGKLTKKAQGMLLNEYAMVTVIENMVGDE